MAQPTFSPPKNRTCEFPRIRLKWRRKALSFALGKRFAVAKLTASLSARAIDRACSSLLAALFRHPRSKSAPAKIS